MHIVSPGSKYLIPKDIDVIISWCYGCNVIKNLKKEKKLKENLPKKEKLLKSAIDPLVLSDLEKVREKCFTLFGELPIM